MAGDRPRPCPHWPIPRPAPPQLADGAGDVRHVVAGSPARREPKASEIEHEGAKSRSGRHPGVVEPTAEVGRALVREHDARAFVPEERAVESSPIPRREAKNGRAKP